MGINKQVREILKDRDKFIPKHEILKLIEERRASAISKKTRHNMKAWIKKKRGGVHMKNTVLGKGLRTAVQAFVAFVVGLIVTVLHVPGVPEAIGTYVSGHLMDVLVMVGLPFAITSGIVAFIQNKVEQVLEK